MNASDLACAPATAPTRAFSQCRSIFSVAPSPPFSLHAPRAQQRCRAIPAAHPALTPEDRLEPVALAHNPPSHPDTRIEVLFPSPRLAYQPPGQLPNSAVCATSHPTFSCAMPLAWPGGFGWQHSLSLSRPAAAGLAPGSCWKRGPSPVRRAAHTPTRGLPAYPPPMRLNAAACVLRTLLLFPHPQSSWAGLGRVPTTHERRTSCQTPCRLACLACLPACLPACV